MSQLKFSDLIDTPVPLTPAEAVALTLAVAEALTARAQPRVPPDDAILLSSTGRVSLEDVTTGDDEDITRNTTTTQLAALTRRLLQLDKRGSVDRRKRVPAALLGTLARAMTRNDLPPITPDEFLQSLQRFGAADPTTLAAMFWRAARLCAPARTPTTTLAPVKVESAVAPRGAEDRRQNVPPPSELRRYLREAERELFEARGFPDRRREAPEAIPALAAAPIEPILQAPLPRAPRGASPLPRKSFISGRFWRVSAGIAATMFGAVLGVVLAFTLSGRGDLLKRELAADPPAVPAAVVASSSGQALQSEEAVHTQARPAVSRNVQPLLLAPGADVFSPSFAPRGRTILFHRGREGAPLMRASVSDSGQVEVNRIETLLDDGAANYHVTMSPDGSRIAYDSDRDGTRGVYVAKADGSAPRRISAEGYAAVPSWSPGGDRVAFVRAEPGSSRVWNVWIADLSSGQLRRVTNHTVGRPWGASWFPDGQRLAYSLEDRLMIADLSTGLARGYRSPRDGRLVRTPAVSPEGRRIVFQVQRDGVWLLDVDRARMRRILDDATAEEFVWSPDGSAIAYHARKGGSYGLWRLALGG